MRFEGRTALVTGATGGIGGAIARRLAEEGATLALHTYSQPDAADALTEALDGDGHRAIQADLMDPVATERLVDEALHGLGKLDVLVNNAGRFVQHRLDEVDYERWREVFKRTLALNLEAPANLAFLAAQAMRETGEGGSIVNISSRGAFRGEPDAPAYGASKAGLNALTQSLAKKLGPDGIQVAAVAPGFVDTEMVRPLLEGDQGEAIRGQSPMDRVAQPEEVAAAVAYLASEEAEFATGTILDLNGASYLRT